MKILVTGGAGFIGSNFIHYLLKRYPDYKIINLDLLTYAGNLENLKDIENNPNYQFVKGDICDKELVDELVKKADAVVHFAAETHVDRSIMDSELFLRTNVLGTHTLLEAARKYNTRFHHISTDEVFGELGPNDPPFNENTPYNPRNPYSASKAAADYLVKSYVNTYNLPVTISNCSNNYGPFQFPEKFIPLAITNLLEGKKIPIYGDGLQRRDWIFVDDHSRGVDLILHKGKIGETYCLGGGNEYPNIEIAKKILEILNENEDMIEYVKDRRGHDRRYSMDITKMSREFGWLPEKDLITGLRETVEWYKNNSNWWQRVKSGEYQEYYRKQYLER
jgi:dTDP-glucose 4,6-dehydratase